MMVKPITKNGTNGVPKTTPTEVKANKRMATAINNALLSRDALFRKLLDGEGRDLNKDAGYPDDFTPELFREMYDREGVAARVVNVYPDECWALNPIIAENEDKEPTEWESQWQVLDELRSIGHYLHRIDRISGIAHYGLLLLGINDGKKLSDPVEGMPERHEEVEPNKQYKKRKLMFMRPFDETLVTISKYEEDQRSPRFGKPIEYNVKFSDPRNESRGTTGAPLSDAKVHWHRVLHVADNRESSEVFGTPRMRPVYNRLHDLRKVLGGSAEMFWKGGFPGYSFEMPAELAATGVINEAAVKKQIQDYYNGLERYLTLKGLTTKSLAPQVASPEHHDRIQLQAISVSIGVPMRIFIGSEEAKLSSTQDSITWNKRLQRRQEKYVAPFVVRPFVDRLIMMGVVANIPSYIVRWPDLNTSTDLEKAEVAERLTKAMAMYVDVGMVQLISPEDFFTQFVGLSRAQAKALVDSALKKNSALEDALLKQIEQQQTPAPQASKPQLAAAKQS